MAVDVVTKVVVIAVATVAVLGIAFQKVAHCHNSSSCSYASRYKRPAQRVVHVLYVSNLSNAKTQRVKTSAQACASPPDPYHQHCTDVHLTPNSPAAAPIANNTKTGQNNSSRNGQINK